MIKKLFLVTAYLIICMNVKAQKIQVQGIARDTAVNRSRVTIYLNDTIAKYSKLPAKQRNTKDFSLLLKDENYVTVTDQKGDYRIQAKLTDTLYFKKMFYFTQKHKVADIIKNNIVVELKPTPCEIYNFCAQEPATDYLVFKGKKISVNYKLDPRYCNARSLNMGGYEYIYEVTEKIYGYFPGDTITFKAYDHYGAPVFTKRDTAVIVLGKHCGNLRHHPCSIPNIFKTKEGKWASAGDLATNEKSLQSSTLKPIPIKFDKTRMINLKDLPIIVKEQYKKPHFNVKGDFAIPLTGIYIDDIIEAKIKMARQQIDEKKTAEKR